MGGVVGEEFGLWGLGWSVGRCCGCGGWAGILVCMWVQVVICRARGFCLVGSGVSGGCLAGM